MDFLKKYFPKILIGIITTILIFVLEKLKINLGPEAQQDLLIAICGYLGIKYFKTK